MPMLEYFELSPREAFYGIAEIVSDKLRDTVCSFGQKLDPVETRLDPELVTLKTSDSPQKFQMQRKLLESSSPYFRALLYKKHGGKYVTEIIVPDMETDTLAKVVHFILYGRYQITSHNVFTLMVAASKLNVDGLVACCSRYLLSNMTYQNCIGIRTFAQNYNFMDVANLAHTFFMNNYRLVLLSSDHLEDLTMTEVRQLCCKWEMEYPEDEKKLIKWLDDFLADLVSDCRKNNLVKYDLPGCEHDCLDDSEFVHLYLQIQDHKDMQHTRLVWNAIKYTLVGALVLQGLRLIYNGLIR